MGLRFAAACLLMLAAFAGIYAFALRQMWCSAGLCALAVGGCALALYRMQVGSLRALQQMVCRICEAGGGGGDALSSVRGGGVMREIGRELEYFFALERKRQWEEAERLRYYEMLLDRVDTGLLVATEEGTVEWCNRAALRQMGHDFRRVPEAWLAQRRGGEACVVPAAGGGAEGELLLSATELAGEGRVRIAFALKNIRNLLEERQNASWRKLITVLTHEIMNSLAPILSLSETLGAQPLPSQPDGRMQKRLHRAMQTIYRRSRGLLDFTQNYRKLTRIPPPQPEEIDAAEFFADLAGLFRDGRLSFDLPYAGCTFRADRGQMEQVLINLIKNAREAAAPEGTDIRVALRRRAGGEVEISVADRGPGMAPEVQEQAFVPFFTTKPGGSGIGLTLCMQIMLQHGGYIYLHSAPGRGSCFTLTLPGGGE